MKRRAAVAAALAATAALALAGCGGDSAPQLKVSGAYMPQPVMKDMAGGFLVIKNTGDTADKLTSVTSDLSDDVTMHRTVGAKMEQVGSLTVPAHGELKLSRGGNHLMFMALKKKPVKGDEVAVELHFGKAKPIKAVLPVKATNYSPQHAGHE
ncbi:copper resistance protein CopZ [Streptomyces sp. Ru73]|nr:copper resistance protein CopZ [Streptomyces sp. Ru73]